MIAGEKEAVARAIECAKARGCRRAIVLPVSGTLPFEFDATCGTTSWYERLAATDIKVPATPVIANIDVEVHETPDAIREALARQYRGGCAVGSYDRTHESCWHYRYR